MNQEEIFDLEKQLAWSQYSISRAKQYIYCYLAEVKNDSGGVIGYKLELNAAQTKYLMDILNERRA